MPAIISKEQKIKVPELRFGEFTDGWKNTKLSELLKESKKRNGDLKYTKDDVLSVSGDVGVVNQVEHLGRSYAGKSVHNYHVVDTGDIVYTKSPLKANPYGVIKVNKGKTGIVSTLYAVYGVIENQAHGSFLDYYFSLDSNTNRYLRPLVKKGAKNDMKINNAHVLQDKIYVPAIDEQRKISSFLDVVIEYLSLLKKEKTSLENYKKDVVQKIFSQKIRFQDDNGKEFPEWSVVNGDEVFENISNKNPQKDLPILAITQDQGAVPRYLINYKVQVSEKGIAGYKVVRKGDFIISLRSFQGGIEYSEYDGLCSPAYIVLRSKIDVNTYFFKFLFKSPAYIGRLISKLEGIRDGKMISFKYFSEAKVQLPSIQEQNKIADFLVSLDAMIESKELQIRKVETWKRGLLQKLFI
ncbi:MAG TPA: restriction endonuclease subunit S [Candidatus Paceibacterota bacterium]